MKRTVGTVGSRGTAAYRMARLNFLAAIASYFLHSAVTCGGKGETILTLGDTHMRAHTLTQAHAHTRTHTREVTHLVAEGDV